MLVAVFVVPHTYFCCGAGTGTVLLLWLLLARDKGAWATAAAKVASGKVVRVRIWRVRGAYTVNYTR